MVLENSCNSYDLKHACRDNQEHPIRRNRYQPRLQLVCDHIKRSNKCMRIFGLCRHQEALGD